MFDPSADGASLPLIRMPSGFVVSEPPLCLVDWDATDQPTLPPASSRLVLLRFRTPLALRILRV